ncbi:MAG: MGH1-like glycoside hydrolase domain-containing protein [Mycobacteriales bacterium]
MAQRSPEPPPELPPGLPPDSPDPERARLADPANRAAWRLFGPYVAERAWGTVREDYSADGDAWAYLPHDAASATAYRWNEDGLGGICDDAQRLCLTFAFWNGQDASLKERVFGLTNSQGNHGEDAKEQWWYIDATPTASWLRWRYRYPQQAFPYADLVTTNAQRTREDSEYELADTGVLDAGCWEVELTVAKEGPRSMVLRLQVTNTAANLASLHVLPTLLFRNTWRWRAGAPVPQITHQPSPGPKGLLATHPTLGAYRLTTSDRDAVALFCDNETNTARRYGTPGPAYPKDGIADHVITGAATVNPAECGTKAALHHVLTVPGGATATLTLLFHAADHPAPRDPDAILAVRQAEADTFHANLLPAGTCAPRAAIARQALAGMLWSQCFYHYDVPLWLAGDPTEPPPPPERRQGRNASWWHLSNHDVISMPDPWEYPWYASWDLAFHAVTLAHADPRLAKDQLLLLFREWYMHPSGQLPAYEWDFSDVNPPVQAWAALEVFRIAGDRDVSFLERAFHKLLINFTWWVNRVDSEGNNVFEGGFLGLDNVGPFDRSHQPPGVGELEQSDGTSWMAMFCLHMLQIALELARYDATYEDVATKFFEHFTYIASALEKLWDDEDGFLYDHMHHSDGTRIPVRVRSIAGLVALAAVCEVPATTLDALPGFATRLAWFIKHRAQFSASCVESRPDGSHLLTALPADRLARVLATVLDEGEFLSPFGLRSLSRFHLDHPYLLDLPGVSVPPVGYEPGESHSGLFGGNSNWRGPVWFPLNALVIAGLRRYGAWYGDQLTVAFPTGTGPPLPLDQAAARLADRLVSLFVVNDAGQPPAAASASRGWPPGLLWFHEYFHGETGAGLGASHQTGWTGLVADLILRPRG